jgi:hypothetical protein
MKGTSKETFEGVRAQDILNLLLKKFHFETSLFWGGMIDHMDIIGALKTFLIQILLIILKHFEQYIIAALKKIKPSMNKFVDNLTPEFCLRKVE